MNELAKDCERILFPAETIAEEVKKAAAWLDARYEGTMPLAISVLKGSVIFFCDLVRAMKTDVELDFMAAKSFTVVSLLDKPSRREVDVQADYSCFTVGNEFIVGYGLDYDQRYRNLPFIGVLKREIYEK